MIIDLTKPLDASFIPYSKGEYSDPPFRITEWSSIAKDGFRVARLTLGTQSGTHIDAPGHFLEDKALLEVMSPERLMGSYFLLSLSRELSLSSFDEAVKAYRDEQILFLRTPENQTSKLTSEIVQKILSLPPIVIVLSGEIEIEDSEKFMFHRLVARAEKFLVEDLDQKAAHRISGNGELFVFPLRLAGVSGSPCRVIARVP